MNSVCNCYKEALETLDEILDVRSAYDTFDEYNKDTESVNKDNEDRDKFQLKKSISQSWKWGKKNCEVSK